MNTDIDQVEAMIDACSFGQIDTVRGLLDAGVDPRASNESGYTALHFAVLNGSCELCALLIERGAPLDVLDGLDRSPLHLAAVCDKSDLMRHLVAAGADLEVPGENEWTPLHAAIREEKPNAVRVLLNLGANIEARDIGLCTPLLVAAFGGNAEIVEFLLNQGANLQAVDDFGNTVLHLVARNTERNHIRDLTVTGLKDGDKRVDLWVRDGMIGATVDGQDTKIGSRTFESLIQGKVPQYFRYQSLVKTAKLLLKKGAQVNAKNKDGLTALHEFAGAGDLELVKAVLKAGANIDEPSKAGLRPLQLAARKGRLDVVKCLLTNKASVNTADEYGCGPLHEAAENGHAECVKALLKKNADPEQRTTKGWDNVPAGLTPLDLAERGRHDNIVNLLL